MYLLDVNLLIALCDADHEHFLTARHWFQANAVEGWATCPLTENALLRIMGSERYPGGPGTPAKVYPLLQRLRQVPGHIFLPCDLSIADEELFHSVERVKPRMLTDLYLLALAVQHGARFATFDKRISPASIRGGEKALVVIA